MLTMLDMPEETRRAIANIEIYESIASDGTVISRIKKIKFYDKIKSLELIGKHFKMWTDKKELSGPEGEPLIVVGGPTIEMSFDEWEKKAIERLNNLGTTNKEHPRDTEPVHNVERLKPMIELLRE